MSLGCTLNSLTQPYRFASCTARGTGRRFEKQTKVLTVAYILRQLAYEDAKKSKAKTAKQVTRKADTAIVIPEMLPACCAFYHSSERMVTG